MQNFVRTTSSDVMHIVGANLGEEYPWNWINIAAICMGDRYPGGEAKISQEKQVCAWEVDLFAPWPSHRALADWQQTRARGVRVAN